MLFYKVILQSYKFQGVVELLECDHSNECFWLVLSCSTNNYAVQGNSYSRWSNLFAEKQVWDILNTESGGLCSDQKFDVCLDKGTYDAISLNPDDATGCQAKYIDNVSCLLASDGVFIICSCNWTKPELLAQFSNSKWDN